MSAWTPEREPTSGPKAPSSLELAAISAAVEEVWPRPGAEEDVVHQAENAWRFANRWWHGSSVGGRGRPRRSATFG